MNTVIAKGFPVDRSLVRVTEQGEVSFNIDGMDAAAIRSAIAKLQEHLLAVPSGFHVEPQIKQTVASGMYMRELFIPKGSLLVGKVHRKPCINIVAAGDITVLTERGVQRIQAGFTGVSEAGMQKAGYAHADTLFINVFRTDETDLAALDRELTCDNHQQLLGDAP